MTITIMLRELDQAYQCDAGRCASAFTVMARLILSVEDGQLSYSVLPVEPFQKIYPPETVDYHSYIHHPERAVFLAYLDGALAGEIRLRRNWNEFALIEDIVVDLPSRRRGVGRALIQQAVAWAQEKKVAGVCLETQDINYAACKLYESCGFVLGGFDRCLYHASLPGANEIALYWYRLFDPSR